MRMNEILSVELVKWINGHDLVYFCCRNCKESVKIFSYEGCLVLISFSNDQAISIAETWVLSTFSIKQNKCQVLLIWSAVPQWLIRCYLSLYTYYLVEIVLWGFADNNFGWCTLFHFNPSLLFRHKQFHHVRSVQLLILII